MRLLVLLVASVAVASPTRTLLLIVRDAGGPVAGATITHDGERTAQTDVRGHATLRSLLRRESIRIEAPGHVTRDLMFERDDPGANVVRDVTLVPGAPIEGSFLDADGKPTAKRIVQLDVDQYTDTDDTGHWRFAAVAAGHHRVADQDVDSDGQHATSIVLRLPQRATIGGVVIDDFARPIAGARVLCEREVTVADADGRFSISTRAGVHHLYAVTATSASPVAYVDVALNEHASVELVLAEHGLAGTVVDTQGQPVVAHVTAEAIFSVAFAETESDAAGHFELGGVPAGEYQVSASLGHGPPAVARVHAGERHVALAVPEAGAIVGRALYRGNPVPAFGTVITWGRVVPTYARDGRFAQRAVNPGPIDITIVAAGFMPRHFAFTIAAGQTIDLGDIELRRGRTLRGRVVDAQGFAVAHAIVRLAYDGDFSDNRRTLDAIWRGHLQTQTDLDGNFAIPGVDPARAGLLEARAGGLRSRRRPLDEDLLIVEATGGISGDIPLRTNDQSRVIASEIAPAGAHAPAYEAEITDDGRFQFTQLPAGEYTIDVDARTSEHVIVAAGEDARVTIAAPRDPVLLTVGSSTCRTVTLRAPGDEGIKTWCHDALAELPAVSAGSYELCVDDDPCTPVELAFEPLRQRVTVP